MVTTNWAVNLFLLALADAFRCTAAVSSSSGFDDATTVINIATIISDSFASDVGDLGNGEFLTQEDSNAFVLVGNTSTSDTWLNTVVGYAAAADGRVLYQTANWEVLEEGAQYEKFSTFWARSQAANTPWTICTMVVDWEEATEASWPDDATVLAAVNVEDRLKDNCGDNDTIVLVFTSAVTDTVDGYLEGEIAVNDAVAPITLQDVLEASEETSAHDHVFVRLANDTCTGDASTRVSSLSPVIGSEIMVTRLLTGDYCAEMSSSNNPELMPPDAPREDRDSSNDSYRKDDLRFIIPVGVCMFLLGCAGLVYVFRDQKKKAADAEPPKDEVKGVVTSLPYVLSIHPVV